MKRNLLFKIIWFLGLMAGVYCSMAQTSFRYRSMIEKVKDSGFYKISLPPDVVAKCTETLSDIRILDEKGKQVPYILQTDQGQFSQSSFIELPILSVKKESDKLTHIVIQNRVNKSISEILLVIKNTEADRSVNISGSDDNVNWFVIRENVPLGNFIYRYNDDSFIQSIGFPASSYHFFKIIINGKDLMPVNIIKAGVYQGLFHASKYLPVPSPAFEQKDSSNNVSYVTVRFNENYLLNKVDVIVNGSKFFRRNVYIRNVISNTQSWGQTFTINSSEPASFPLNIKTKQLVLEIANEDNPPLNVSAVKAFQLNKSLLAYLDPTMKYELMFGNPEAHSPNYDLAFFKDSIATTAPEVNTGSITTNNAVKAAPKTFKKNNTLILWGVIGAVLVLLLLLTVQITKEMKRKENS